MRLFFTQDRTGRRKWCLVWGEQICHPISDCSSILFPPPFLCSLCPLLILALSPQPMSPSHPYSPILTLAAPSFLTFCNRPDRQLSMPSSTFPLILSPFHSPLLLFFIYLSFIRFLSPSLSLSLSRSARGVGFSCRGARWICDCCRAAQRALSLVTISLGGQAKAAEKGKKKCHFFIGCIWP